MSHHNYDAFWIPGLDTDFDADEALRLGYKWLQDSAADRTSVIALNAASMTQNRPLLARMGTRVPVVSRLTRSRARLGRSPHAVLAVWPTVPTLEFSEGLASGGGLCVIPNSLDEMSAWMARTAAVNLADPAAPPVPGPNLNAEVKQALDHTLLFDGHNQFGGGYGKEDAIRTLRQIAAMKPRPMGDDIAAYALASGETGYEGAARLREWYEGILAGKTFRDYRGRPI
jgi:hypothetical protein